jgi:tyrosine-protein kinase Etk/Wzc
LTEQKSLSRQASALFEDEANGMALPHLIGVVSEARWLIAGVTAAVFVIVAAYAFLRTPKYRADTVVQVLSQQAGGLSGLEQFSALIQGSTIPTDTEIQLLQTRAVLMPVIEKLHLNIVTDGGLLSNIGARLGLGCGMPAVVSSFTVPQAFEGEKFTITPTGQGGYRLYDPDGNAVLAGTVGKPAVGRLGRGGNAALAIIKVDSIAPCAGKFGLTRIPMDQEVASLLKLLTIEQVGPQTGVVQISLTGTSPDLLTTVLNEIAETNVRQNIKQSASQAAKQLEFVRAQIPDLEHRLEAAQQKLAQFLSTNPTLAALSQSTEYLVSQAASIDQQIGPLQAQVAQAKASLGAQNPQLKVLSAQLSALQKQRADLLASIAKLPKDQQTLARLQTDVTTNQGLYSGMLNQIQTLLIARASTIGDVVIVDPALRPSKPIFSSWLITAAGLPLGLLFGVLAAFGVRMLRHGIENPEEIDERLGLQVYAVLPHCIAQRRLERRRNAGVADGSNTILAAIETADQTTEALRSLRTALQLAFPRERPHILCITSLGPGEGKSFLASNLGYLFAQGGLRVLLVDADLRRGHLHRSLGWGRGKGLSEVLGGELAIEGATKATQLGKLDVMTTGALPDDAANLLAQSDVGALLDRLGSLYDLVIMDVPPVLAVGDAYMIARHATLNLLVLKYGLHSINQVRFVLKRFAHQGIPVSGCVLNDVSVGAQRYAYRGYGYQYQYTYK